jgi:hypothetical protein
MIAMHDEEPSPDFVRFTEIEDVVVSAELVAHLAPLLDSQPSYWKWVIVAAHSALQGAMVCALADSTGTSVLEQESAKKTLDWLEDMCGEPPAEKLLSFKRLLSRCTSGSDPLLAFGAERQRDITQLHDDFRNNFTHFLPHQGRLIEKAGLPRIITAAMDAVESLMGRWPIPTTVSECQQARLSKALYDWRAAFVSDAS